MASDLGNIYKLYKEAEAWSLMFGIQLADVIQVFDQFIDMTVTPLPGLPLTVVGLVVLLLGGVGRLVVAILDRVG
jgi:branched-subunit amino acid ABC-type transport system permease component